MEHSPTPLGPNLSGSWGSTDALQWQSHLGPGVSAEQQVQADLDSVSPAVRLPARGKSLRYPAALRRLDLHWMEKTSIEKCWTRRKLDWTAPKEHFPERFGPLD
jgi:hypothetical protein